MTCISLIVIQALLISSSYSRDFARIGTGYPTLPNEWPSQALIIEDSLRDIVCGGSLITEEWVLTSADCLDASDDFDPMHFKVVVGMHNLYVPEDDRIISAISQIVIHPKYDSESHAFDIALIRLSKPVGNENVKPICLDLTGIDISNTSCYATGYGIIRHHVEYYPAELHQIQMKPYDLEKCKTDFNDDPDSKEKITEQQFCMVTYNPPNAPNATSRGGACIGDSGGPLQCLHNEQWYQIGVIWASEHCDHSPTVFNWVPGYAEFIQKYSKYKLPSRCEEILSFFRDS